MSNERFDKLMKKQLESVRPAYQPRAWDRFRKRLPVVGFWPWLGQYGGWVLSGLMLAGWLTTLCIVHENQAIIAQLSTELRKPMPARQPIPPSISLRTESSRLHRIDTVYIVKRTVVEHQHFYTPSTQYQANPGPIAQRGLATEQYVDPNELLTKSTSTRTTYKIHRRIQPGTSSPLSEFSRQSMGNQPAAKTTHTEKIKSTLPLLTDSANVVINTDQESTGKVTDIEPQQTPLKSTDLALVKPDSVTQKPALASTQEQTQPAKQSRPAFRFSSLKPRVGIESMIIHRGIGIGPTVELFLSENLGLSMGLQAAQLHSQMHRDLNDFNAATGKDFISQYQSYLPTQYDRIDDISIHTSVISLPMTLKYYVPLKRNWSLLFQTGTSFDLAVYQQVHYDSDLQGSEQFHSFEVNAQRTVFHNFIFGAGIQYHKSRVSGQIVPYYLYDFRSITNTPTGSNFGLKASVWLDLAK